MRSENRNDPDRVDPLDALLASRPVRRTSSFADEVFARIAIESAESDDASLDRLLASRPARLSGELPDRVLSAVVSERRRRFRLFRVLPGISVAAACLVAALIPTLRSPSGALGDRVAAALNGDAELMSLIALPSAKSAALHPDDLAVLADLGAAFAVELPDHVYEI